MKIDLSGLCAKQDNQSGRLVIHLAYLPPEDVKTTAADLPQGFETWPEEFTVLRTIPKCSKRRAHGTDERLCGECWLLEFVNCVGVEDITDRLEWEGRGERACTLAVSGHMVSKFLGSGPDGDDWDEKFEVVSFNVLPPEEEGR